MSLQPHVIKDHLRSVTTPQTHERLLDGPNETAPVLNGHSI